MNNVIYTVYDSITPCVKCHITSLRRYCSRYNIHLQQLHVSKQTLTKFVKHDAFKHFIQSNYDNMLYVDWDVVISEHSENIFDVYRSEISNSLCVYYLPEDQFPDYDYINYYDQFKKMIGADHDFKLERYFNSGVLATSRHMLESVYNEIERYSKIIIEYICKCSKDTQNYILDNVARDEFLLNYIVTRRLIETTSLDKKWNTAYVENTCDGWRSSTDPEVLDSNGYFLHFNKSSIEDKIISMKRELGDRWKEKLYE